jgi:hypothetical protein
MQPLINYDFGLLEAFLDGRLPPPAVDNYKGREKYGIITGEEVAWALNSSKDR